MRARLGGSWNRMLLGNCHGLRIAAHFLMDHLREDLPAFDKIVAAALAKKAAIASPSSLIAS